MLHKIEYKDLNNKHLEGKSILAFRATWCPPCRMLGPELERLAAEYEDINIFDMDVDSDNNKELAREMGVSSIPSLFYFENGKQINQSVGYLPLAELLKKFNK